MPSLTESPRFTRVQRALEDAAADWLLLPASPDFRWLTGAEARVSERMVAIAVPCKGEPFIVAPRLEASPLAESCPGVEMLVWDEADDPLARLAERTSLGPASTLLLGEGLRVPQVLRLTTLASCGPAADVVAPLRACKDAAELECIAEAARHADQVVEETADFARAGMTELEVARFATARFEALGDTDVWTIVASGPNSAIPHHHTSARVLKDGEPLLLDMGASTRGYCSDITRTYFLGEPSRQFLRAWGVVNAAREAGIAAVRAGAVCEDVDAATRGVIEQAGLGEAFTHRTGHGLGLEIHETPYLVKGNRAVLERGNVHSVEPGVYFPGKFGIRLEDIVAVEDGGARRFNQAPLDVRVPRLRA